MPDYIPSKDPDKIAWLIAFGNWLTADSGAHAIAHGISLAQALAFQTEAVDASEALMAAHKQAALARAAAIDKDEVIGAAIATARAYAQKLQHDFTMTDADRAAAGITVPDPANTPAAPQSVAEMEPPLLLLDFHIRHQVSIHWGPNPGNEHQNGKPRGILGCELQYARGGLPADESGWTSLGLDTDSPMLHHIETGTSGTGNGVSVPIDSGNSGTGNSMPVPNFPNTFVYRARYVDKTLHYGNFGDPAECTVSL